MPITPVLRVDPERPEPAHIAAAARLIREGRLVVFPTETVYGLGANALDPEAVRRIFAAKGRPEHHPLIAHVEGEERARSLAGRWTDTASLLARTFWPGPLTLVVPRAAWVPPEVAGGGATLAIRAPAHPVARALIAAADVPLAAPSANRYQELSPTTAAHVLKSLDGLVDLVLDGGPCAEGIESTVVDVTGDVPRVLRPGALGLGALRAVLPDVQARAEVALERASRVSPGMDARHYAPRARLILADTWGEAHRIALGIASQGGRVGLLVYHHEEPSPHPQEPLLDLCHARGILVRVMPHEPSEYARELFSVLHDMDDSGVDAVVVEQVPDGDDAWWAVADRLRRGAAAREIAEPHADVE